MVALLQSIGADHVIDHTQQDFTTAGPQYDVIPDNVGNRSLSECRRAITPNGILIPNANSEGRWVGGYVRRAIQALAVSPFVSQKLRPFPATENAQDLTELTNLIEDGKVTPVIDRTYPLSQTAEAISY